MFAVHVKLSGGRLGTIIFLKKTRRLVLQNNARGHLRQPQKMATRDSLDPFHFDLSVHPPRFICVDVGVSEVRRREGLAHKRSLNVFSAKSLITGLHYDRSWASPTYEAGSENLGVANFHRRPHHPPSIRQQSDIPTESLHACPSDQRHKRHTVELAGHTRKLAMDDRQLVRYFSRRRS